MKKLLLLALLLLPLPAQAGDASEAGRLYDQALRPGIALAEKAALLQASLDAAFSYSAYFELGRVYNMQENPAKALDSFERAAAVAGTPVQRAQALGVAGRLAAAMGNPAQAVPYLKKSLELSYDQGVAGALLAVQKELGEQVPSDAIKGALTKGLNTRGLGVEPSIDLRVGFEFDSCVLTPKGRAQVEELARALSDAEYAGKELVLTGHTDRRGEDAHNDRLSLQRAQAVRDYLQRKCGLTSCKISVAGKGRRSLLFREESEDAHAMNRRVEVKLQ